MHPAAAARHTGSQDLASRRLAVGVLLSVLLHGLVLSLQFGSRGPAPGAARPLTISMAAPDPLPLPAPETSAIAPLPTPARTQVRSPVAGLTLLDPVSAPSVPVAAPPARQAKRARRKGRAPVAAERAPLRVITRDRNPDAVFKLPLPPDEEAETMPERLRAQHGVDTETGEARSETIGEPEAAPVADSGSQPAPEQVADLERLQQQEAEARLLEQQRIALAQVQAGAEKQAAEERARTEAQRVAQEQAHQVASQQARTDAQRLAQEQAQQAAGEQARTEAQRVAQEQAQQAAGEQARTEAERVAQEQAQQAASEQARTEAQRVAQEQAQQAAGEQARQAAQRVAEAERSRIEASARAQAQQRLDEIASALAARKQAEEDARQQADQLARKRQAELDAARRQAEEMARRQREREQQDAEQLAARQADDLAQQAGQSARQSAQRADPGRESGAAGAGAGSTPAGAAGVTIPKHLLGSEVATRARDMVRGIDILRGTPPAARPAQDELRSRRRAMADAAERDVPLRMYVDSFREKIERNAAMIQARLAPDRVRTDPLVSVALRSDGSVEDVTIVRSSGRPDTDEAVRRIVRVNARYSAFPPNVAARYDVIEIRRIWTFTERLKLLEEVR